MGEVGLVALPPPRVAFGPPEPGEFGNGGLAVAIGTGPFLVAAAVELGAGDKPSGVADFAATAGDQDRAQALEGESVGGFG